MLCACLFPSATPRLCKRGLARILGVGTPSTPVWSYPLSRPFYIMWLHAICYSMYTVFGATSVRSLLELPQHGVSWPPRHGTPGRRRGILIRSPPAPPLRYGVSRHLSPYNVPLGCTMSCLLIQYTYVLLDSPAVRTSVHMCTSPIKVSGPRTLGSSRNCQFAYGPATFILRDGDWGPRDP